MISIFGFLACALNDPEATYSFISHNFLPYANVRPTSIVGSFMISLPMEDVLFAGMVFRDSYIQGRDAVLEAYLIPLDIVDHDVILGMNWLEKHHVLVDCFRKEVLFQSPG